MSDSSLLEQLKAQLKGFVTQREQIQNNFQQIVGAIFACESLIKDHEEKLQNNEVVVEAEQTTGGE